MEGNCPRKVCLGIISTAPNKAIRVQKIYFKVGSQRCLDKEQLIKNQACSTDSINSGASKIEGQLCSVIQLTATIKTTGVAEAI